MCSHSTFNIENIINLYIECDGDGACSDGMFNINNITNNVTILCDGGCQEMQVNINESNYFDISCERWWGERYKNTFLDRPCDDLEVNGLSMNGVNLYCEDQETCSNINICLDGTLNIDCAGEDSCNFATFCNDAIISTVNCAGLNSSFSCQIPYQSGTKTPTQFVTKYPTKEITAYPTSVPTQSPPLTSTEEVTASGNKVSA
eukprot:343561_1